MQLEPQPALTTLPVGHMTKKRIQVSIVAGFRLITRVAAEYRIVTF